MKDKRQRMAMAWPLGIADPHLYAYLAAAAASYPYGIPQSSPMNYYSSLGMSRPTLPSTIPSSPVTSQPLGSLGQYPFPNPLRPHQDQLPGLSSAFLGRSPGMHPQFPFHSSPLVTCPTPNETSPRGLNTSGTLNSSGGSISPGFDESPYSHATSVHLSHRKSPTSKMSPPMRSVGSGSPNIAKSAAAQSNTTPPGLFRPFDIDRS